MIVLDFLRGRPLFFALMMAFPSIVAFAHFSSPEQEVFKGQNLGIVVGLGLMAAITALWTAYRPLIRWVSVGRMILVLVLLWWIWELGRIWIESTGFNYLALAPLLFILLILVKRPNAQTGNGVFAVLGLSIVVVALVSYVAGSAGAMPDSFVGPEGGIPTRYPILEQLIGADSRWIGPFSSVNYTSAAGGLAVIAGLATSGPARWVCVAGGTSMLLLSQGDAALFAALLAGVVYVLWGRLEARLRWPAWLRFTVVAALASAGGVLAAQLDGGFRIRLSTWQDFASLWRESPLFGVGMNRVYEFINQNTGNEGFVPYTHAHSVVLNGLALYGLIWGLLFLSVVVLIGISAYRALPRVGSGPLAVVTYVVLAGIAETTYSATSWTLYLAALVAVLAVTSSCEPREVTSTEPDYPEPRLKGGA